MLIYNNDRNSITLQNSVILSGELSIKHYKFNNRSIVFFRTGPIQRRKAKQKETRLSGSEAGEESRQDLGHRDRGLHRLLASLLHLGDRDGHLQRPRVQPHPRLLLSVARLLQLNPEPDHLHHLQPGVPVGLSEDVVRQAEHESPASTLTVV